MSQVSALYLENYRQFINKYIKLDGQSWQIIAQNIREVHYKKGHIIHSQGDICHKMLYICQGVARSYLLDEAGNDRTWKLFFNDENSKMINLYATDYGSFLDNSPSMISIEAVEDCDFLCFDRKLAMAAYSRSNIMNTFGRIMSEQAYLYEHYRHISHITESAKERLLNLLKTEPYLLDKVPQYHIASLLNITPQHLSRLKKQL